MGCSARWWVQGRGQRGGLGRGRGLLRQTQSKMMTSTMAGRTRRWFTAAAAAAVAAVVSVHKTHTLTRRVAVTATLTRLKYKRKHWQRTKYSSSSSLIILTANWMRLCSLYELHDVRYYNVTVKQVQSWSIAEMFSPFIRVEPLHGTWLLRGILASRTAIPPLSLTVVTHTSWYMMSLLSFKGFFIRSSCTTGHEVDFKSVQKKFQNEPKLFEYVKVNQYITFIAFYCPVAFVNF